MSTSAPFHAAWSLVAQARRHAGWTQHELAQRCGTAQPAISMYERGRRLPDLSTLERIVTVCGLELRMSLAAPDAQRAAARERVDEMTVEERLLANDDLTRLAGELRS